MARNKVDQALGFPAPLWVDEIMVRRRINRQTASTDEIEKALRAEVSSALSRLGTTLAMVAENASELGLKVVAEDLRAMSRQVKNTPPQSRMKDFYSRSSKPEFSK